MDSAINRLAKQFVRHAEAVRGGYQLTINMTVDLYQDLMLEVDQLDIPRCRICGCSDTDPCPHGCGWAEDDLCSECVTTDRLHDAAPGMLKALVSLESYLTDYGMPDGRLFEARAAIARATGENDENCI